MNTGGIGTRRLDRAGNALRMLFAVALVTLIPVSGLAREALPASDDPALEQRMMNLASEMRCLVCQNQTLADSAAELAADMREEIRIKMRAGASDREVIDYVVARYGDFVLYRPPLKAKTLLLWSGPAILLLLGIMLLMRNLARRPKGSTPALGEAAQARAQDLLGTNQETEST